MMRCGSSPGVGPSHLEVAGAYHLPVFFLADNPGVMAGSAAERAGALRSAARMFFAQSKLAGPKLHVTLRKAFGFGSSIMAMNPFDRQTVTLAFPGATLGAIPAGAYHNRHTRTLGRNAASFTYGPEIKWFFRKTDNLAMPTDPEKASEALDQWKKVIAFRTRMQSLDNLVFYTEYPGADGFAPRRAFSLFDRRATYQTSPLSQLLSPISSSAC